MDIEKNIIDFLKSKNKKLKIAGLRGLVKTGEEEWSFRYTFQEGNYLSISPLMKVRLEGIKKIPILIGEKKQKQVKPKKAVKNEK